MRAPENIAYHVLIVATHCLSRVGIASLVARTGRAIVAVECSTVCEALSALDAQPFDVVLLHLTDPPAEAMHKIRMVRTRHPRLVLGVFSENEDAAVTREFFEAGVRGYISLLGDQKETQRAINCILEGGVYFPPALGSGSTQSRERREYDLTRRQCTVLELLLKGDSNKEIAKRLNLSPYTVKIHVGALLRFFSVRCREDLRRELTSRSADTHETLQRLRQLANGVSVDA